MESSASARDTQSGDAGFAVQQQEKKKLVNPSTPEGLRLLEQARALEIGLNGSPVDLQKAFALYQKAAALGSAEAWYRMGVLARDEKVDGVDAKSAMKFFKEAADAGYTDAYAALARAYMEGQLTKPHVAKADFYLNLALEAGSAEAMFLKGSLLVGTDGSEQVGLTLLMEAAKEGNADAQYMIGRMYRDGMVVGRDMDMAAQWLHFAVENGSVRAKTDLGLLMLNDKSLEAGQREEVGRLLSEAADAGNGKAAYALAKLFFEGKPSLGALTAIREYAENAYDSGRSDGAFLMALSHAVGKNPDLDRALQWLEMGKADQSWRSQYALLLIQGGADTVNAFKTVASSEFKDWMNAFAETKSTSGNVTLPKFIELTKPKMPDSLAALNIKGTVTVAFVVAEDGTPQGIQVLKSSHPGLNDAAMKTVETWKMTPATKGGQYVPHKIRIPISFGNGQ
ncbi:hypothetical protein AW736_19680 [Termitidicoccus mucosus]|uniref:TonB C-terminal domain-containing protein n=2 Tax=Termitidicoccus mucosus TaxID=1184151 RepID=A0A178IEW8_9BACT|nr:hypothetical protein AW736_19680 [Opitutaceae bacterium TSB47]